jgi:hypothetical protein
MMQFANNDDFLDRIDNELGSDDNEDMLDNKLMVAHPAQNPQSRYRTRPKPLWPQS